MDSSASESENESIQTDDSEHNYIPGLPPIVYDSIEIECVYNLDLKSLMTSHKNDLWKYFCIVSKMVPVSRPMSKFHNCERYRQVPTTVVQWYNWSIRF